MKTFTIIAVIALAAIGIGYLAINAGPEGQISLGVSTQAEAEYPEPSNYAVDAAGALSADQLASLNAKLKALDTDKHQFGVAIVKTTQPLDITAYGIKLAEKWKVGGADTDNGAIIIIATEDRQVRIEVGYGLEGDVNDAAAGKILDIDMVPHLKSGDWYGAIVAGLDALTLKIK